MKTQSGLNRSKEKERKKERKRDKLMSSLGGLPCFLCLFLVLVLIKILHKLWWTPTRIQKQMALQGIHGPPYKLTNGNTKEISHMMKEAMAMPKTISHDTLPLVQAHIHSWTNIYGKNYLQWHGSQAQLVITEPELCKEILNNKDGAYPKKKVQNFVKKLLGDGLVSTTEDEKWAKLRKLATLAFHGESLKSMIPEMVASAETMLGRWKNYEGKEIDVLEEFRLLSSEVISRTAFGSSYIEGKNIYGMLNKLGFIIYKNYLIIRVPVISKFFKTSDEIESEKLEKGIQDTIIEIIKKMEEKAMTGGEDRFGSDYLGLLVEAQHDADDNQRISVDEVVDDCKTFYMSGQETTTTLLSWTVLLLAVHTDWQEEARKEFIQLFGKQTPHPDGIAKLKTMSMIINESLRLYLPPVSIIRKVEREVRLGKLTLPPNLDLVISTIAIHHDPEIWGRDVHLFKPERFSEGVAKETNNNIGAFIPFGLGPRTCVGLNFGTTEAKIALSMILQRYSFTLSPGYVHFPLHYLTIRPQHGVQVMLHSL
ncbi:cytochrome P450 CYP749A22-like [Prunus avium]|uniref:Cytochrome P450 CYP749A22-like n=1 Tax=Prunus avium TaxID=42229 RepID=A0A6P5S5R8_PRUAV|nr:cytochrome P450 CYP749A22-like [Prunus avium]